MTTGATEETSQEWNLENLGHYVMEETARRAPIELTA